MIARFMIPLVMVTCGLVWFMSTRDQNRDQDQYSAKAIARVFAKDCRENGRSRGGVIKYVFILNRQAYEGQASGELCLYYAIGGEIPVNYVPDAPEKNIPIPIRSERIGAIGAFIWAVIIYFGIIVFGWMIAPPPKKPRHKG